MEDHYHFDEEVVEDETLLVTALMELGLVAGNDDDAQNRKGVFLPSAETLVKLALDPDTRQAALQHVIARVIFDSLSMQPTGKTKGKKVSLLPPCVSVLVDAMPPCEKHMGNPDGKSIPFFLFIFVRMLQNVVAKQPKFPLAISFALNRWRQLSVFLLNAKRSDRGVLVPDIAGDMTTQADALVASLDGFLGPFVVRAQEQQRSHLQAVALECAKFGYNVFSQPAEFVWRFGMTVENDTEESKSEKEEDKEEEVVGEAEKDEKMDTDEEDETEEKKKVMMEIVVCPGLDKVTDERGNRCDPETIVAPEIYKT